jgi:hypothetical protein
VPDGLLAVVLLKVPPWKILQDVNSHLSHPLIFDRLMRQSQDRGPVVILVKDQKGETFGGFYTVGLNYGEGFVGTGESFLFKFDVRIFLG